MKIETTLREAAQQALEALESLFNWQVDHERGKRCGDAITALHTALEQPEKEPVAWMCSNQSLVHKGYSRFSSTSSDDWNIPVYTKPQENIICERCEELAADKATWYRMAEMFANRLEELKKKGA